MLRYDTVIKAVFTLLTFLLIFPALCLANADRIFQENNDAVVVINTYGKKNKPTGQGSGFIISTDGVIVTNYHVIDGAKKITIKMGKKIIKVEKVISKDKANDLAILKIKRGNYSLVTMGSMDDISIGENVYVIGSPQGLENTISDGILSGLRELAPGKKVLQITAPISPGSSGGPVFNEEGKVVGVVTFQVRKAQNLNFAMPIDLVNYRSGIKKAPIVKSDKPRPPEVKKPEPRVVSSGPSSLTFTADDDPVDRVSGAEADYWFKLGLSYGKAGKYKKEIDAYKKAIEIDPDHAKSYYNLGIVYSYLGIYQMAADSYKEAIRLNPRHSDAYYNLGIAYGNLNRYDDAIKAYEEALKIRPDYASAHYNLGLIFLKTGKRDAALRHYNALRKIDPELSGKLLSQINR
jgi:tetratricopeptide (TPR) repeat protein